MLAVGQIGTFAGDSMSLVSRILSAPRRPPQTGGRTAGQLVYAVGDIHGRYDLLQHLLRMLAADASLHAQGRRGVVIFCGDYIDRGPQSAQVLEALIWLQHHAEFEVRVLKGNHEQALLDFLREPAGGAAWIEQGGAATLKSYGIDTGGADQAVATDLVLLRDALLAVLPASHLRLIETLELMVVLGGYAFVHAGVRPGRPLARQAEHDLLWIREDFTHAPGPFEKTIVHGHSWRSDQPEIGHGRIGLDTGAYKTGVLTAVRLDDDAVVVLQARDPEAEPWNPWATEISHRV